MSVCYLRHMNHYRDYFWKKGVPYGVSPVRNLPSYKGISYCIIADPYKKRISVEQYQKEAFKRVIYDSALLDFRHLNPTDQTAWEKIPIEETQHNPTCLIRNQDGRAIFFEHYQFEGRLCRLCEVKSVHGYRISIQKILYTSLGDPFNGVILFDANEHPIMYKRYAIDGETREFTEVIEENRDMQAFTAYGGRLSGNIAIETPPFHDKPK